jgi:hypothetical protein
MNPFWVIHMGVPFVFDPSIARDAHRPEHVPSASWGSLRDNWGGLRKSTDGVFLLP